MTTKEKILMESMRLFAVCGFEATSVRAIAAAVGVTNSALYKHFKSKQEIFDAIVSRCKERFCDAGGGIRLCEEQGLSAVKEFCLDMFRFQTEDEWIVLFRQLLLLEQFKNEQMKRIYCEFFIDMPVNRMAEIFSRLIESGIMKNKSPKMLASQLYAPFYLHHLDTVSEKEQVMALLRQHMDSFYSENLL